MLIQVGLKGESLGLHTVSGSSSVEWAEGSLLAQKQPMAWYKVKNYTYLKQNASFQGPQ